MKVLVRSRYKEVKAATGRVWGGDGNVHLQYRQFLPPTAKSQHGETYMTPQEAKFLVESPENIAHVEAGEEAPYSYPLGHPVPVADNFGGTTLTPPLTDKTVHVSDVRQTESAVKLLAERDAAIALAKAQDDAEERGEDPNTVKPEPGAPTVQIEKPEDRKARVARERARTRASE
jgi:hypothetical protein